VTPATLGADHYPFYHADLAAFADLDDALSPELAGALPDAFEDNVLGLQFEALERYLSGEDYAVVEADSDPDAVVETLSATGYSRDGTHDGYEVLVADDDSDAYAVGDDVVVGGRPSRADAGTTVRDAVDTGGGDRERYGASVEPMGTLLDALPSGTFVTGRSHERNEVTNVTEDTVVNRVAVGTAFAVGAETTEATVAMVFTSADDLFQSEVRLWGLNRIQTASADRSAFAEMDLSVDGNVATIEASIDTAALTTAHLLLGL
jgi:hypothetical protein